ncbi:hypothetical protein KIPB_008230 [Kipferlia bialata]|uniref:Uncharacterized protein n=1 Tax=Kipferlia bialata TaxID=797122 RepID=A0A391NNF8_9EUKA|nr:hypothetical protein KIPB_008230 [Kipferlia bialata]|eukprot:g8230.t1
MSRALSHDESKDSIRARVEAEYDVELRRLKAEYESKVSALTTKRQAALTALGEAQGGLPTEYIPVDAVVERETERQRDQRNEVRRANRRRTIRVGLETHPVLTVEQLEQETDAFIKAFK